MAVYFVNNNAQPNGDHEVHRFDCRYLPASKTNLGDHATCHSAVQVAKLYYRQSNGCAFCSPACNTG